MHEMTVIKKLEFNFYLNFLVSSFCSVNVNFTSFQSLTYKIPSPCDYNFQGIDEIRVTCPAENFTNADKLLLNDTTLFRFNVRVPY